MSQKFNMDLVAFNDIPKQDTLKILFDLNQENVPEVGSLPSINVLKNLIQLSSLNFYVLNEKEIIGFVTCFREGSEYHSSNYKFFSNSEERFLYIDRIIIKNGFRRKGAGTILYDHLSSIAVKEGVPLCCEVNIVPKNQISLNFHANNGFVEVGSHNFEDHSVLYLKK